MMRKLIALFGIALVVTSLSGCLFPPPGGGGWGGGHGGGGHGGGPGMRFDR
ncbi:MAG: hypothetical protein E6560_12620 [Yersiniaceae bacterium]|uniref:hypothetical protein n=1 Tax=Chimaeribacter coloradensis TaxID=2060068 RepID=UPI0013FCF918|nr:hypothetical protein [Chimaeribacter coloradensis]MDU6411786.1 hypothetical protein [Yersiniaceae bacterium]